MQPYRSMVIYQQKVRNQPLAMGIPNVPLLRSGGGWLKVAPGGGGAKPPELDGLFHGKSYKNG